ncbi:MAG: c-type cytochrome [Bacteroidetes bacterium]|nr:c-type cytochrome [Bacteroidota bacterium]MDA1119875.1 c-type cytochrome [Bacteroidota bacterium]
MENILFYIHNSRCFLLPTLFVAMIGCQNKPTPNYSSGATPPDETVSTFELREGFKIELLASEPLISDPVDMEIDEYGNLYVVEMHGYPLDKSGVGNVKLLKDTDGDGKMDKSTVYAENLIWPFGIIRWKKGILIADAPNVLYLEDRDEDGYAEIRDTVITGFAFSNAQMNIGNPVYGIDNWIYLTSESGGTQRVFENEFGNLGGDVHFPNNGDAPVLPLVGRGRTVRFKPDQYMMELTSGSTQFGRTFDVWGHHILANNSNHIYHEVIAATYLARNHDLPVSSSIQTLSNHGSEVYSISKNSSKQLMTSEGVFTSACGITAYHGGAFPPPYDGNVHFVAEPVSNLVHADLLEDVGVSFSAARIGNSKSEFLASTDSWFRPVNMYVGPDGALYVIDYYRQIIEHPEWMSEEARTAGDLYNGNDMGRIYRITPTNGPADSWTKGLALGDNSGKELVQYLSNKNSWWRFNAQRLLIDRKDKNVKAQLEEMAKKSTNPLGRLHSLWTLDGLDSLDPSLILFALKDSVAGIRENAIRLAEKYLSRSPEMISSLFSLKNDPDPKVRFQLLCTLGFINTPNSEQIRKTLLFQDLQDPWVQIAALSASSFQAGDLLEETLANFDQKKDVHASLVERLTNIIGLNGDSKSISNLIRKSTHPNQLKLEGWETAVLNGLADGIERRKGDLGTLEEEQNLLIRLYFESPSATHRNALLGMLGVIGMPGSSKLKPTMAKVLCMAKNQGISTEQRVMAIQFIALAEPSPHASFLKHLIVPQEEHPIQLAALSALGQIPDQTMSDYMLEQWHQLTPEMRSATINMLLDSQDRAEILLYAIEDGRIQKSNLNFSQKIQFMNKQRKDLLDRARSLFAIGNAGKVREDYEEVLHLKGKIENGKDIFSRNCALCHQVRGELGNALGPDLGTVYNWKPEGIITHILEPNLAITLGYGLWEVQLSSGKSFQGIISSETSTAITLKNIGNQEHTISRGEIKTLKSLDVSAMPEGFENNISKQEMADLIVFLTQKNN